MDRQAHFNSLMQRIDQRKQAMSSYYANRAKSRGLLDQAGQGPLSGMDTGSGIGHMPPPRPSFGGRETMDLRPGDGGWNSATGRFMGPANGGDPAPLVGNTDHLQLYGGTPLASHVGGMLGGALASGGPFGLGRTPSAGAAPNQPKIGLPGAKPLGTPGPQQHGPTLYPNNTDYGSDAVTPGMFPSNLPKPPAGPAPDPAWNPAPRFQNQPDLGPPGNPPIKLGYPARQAEFERNQGIHNSQRRLQQNIPDKEAKIQKFEQDQDERNYQTGLANLRPGHFGGAYGDSLTSGMTDRNRENADNTLYGGNNSAPLYNDPRFASMDRFLKPQTVDINPFKANVREQSWKDMNSRNGYGLNRGPGDNSEHVRPMNMQPLVSEDQASNARNGTVIGQYGNSDLVRINGKNVLIGRKSPNYSEVVQGTKSPRQASDEGRSRTANEYLMADAAAAGIDTSKPEWKGQILGINRANHQAQMQQNQNRRGLQRMYADGQRRHMNSQDIRSMYGVSTDAATKKPAGNGKLSAANIEVAMNPENQAKSRSVFGFSPLESDANEIWKAIETRYDSMDAESQQAMKEAVRAAMLSPRFASSYVPQQERIRQWIKNGKKEISPPPSSPAQAPPQNIGAGFGGSALW